MANIILVDDEAAIRGVIARILRRWGHDVREAEDGKRAMAALAEAGADLIITDINMPEMDGIEIINALRQQAIEVPVIAISGGGQIHKKVLLDSAGLLGAVVTVSKPFDPEELRSAIDRVLGSA